VALKCAAVISPIVCADPQGQGRPHFLSNRRPWWGSCKLHRVEEAAIQWVDLGTTGEYYAQLFLPFLLVPWFAGANVLHTEGI
jgi:hypothetical protein